MYTYICVCIYIYIYTYIYIYIYILKTYASKVSETAVLMFVHVFCNSLAASPLSSDTAPASAALEPPTISWHCVTQRSASRSSSASYSEHVTDRWCFTKVTCGSKAQSWMCFSVTPPSSRSWPKSSSSGFVPSQFILSESASNGEALA